MLVHTSSTDRLGVGCGCAVREEYGSPEECHWGAGSRIGERCAMEGKERCGGKGGCKAEHRRHGELLNLEWQVPVAGKRSVDAGKGKSTRGTTGSDGADMPRYSSAKVCNWADPLRAFACELGTL